jgi:predicted acyltransferase
MLTGRSNGRSIALDGMRGLAVAGMIVVVSPGAWEHVHPLLRHAVWHGWTPADMVFPAFLFCVGVALGLPFLRPDAVRPSRAAWLKALRRSALLVAIGLALNSLPDLDPAHLRIPGILQRIAVCYLLAFMICVVALRDGRFRIRWIVGAALLLLSGYWLILTVAPTPGFGAGRLDPVGAFPAWLDRSVFTPDHLWRYGTADGVGVVYDPEGLLASLPATVNVLIGVLAARLIVDERNRATRLTFGALAAALILAALALDPLMPINKPLWTPTFALLSSGVALGAFVLLEWGAGLSAGRPVAAPFRVMGGNAMLAFILSQLMGVVGALSLLPDGQSLQGWGFQTAQIWIADPVLASFACAMAVLGLILAILYPLDRLGWRLKL